MSFNIIDAAQGLLTNELMGKASSFLGENETGVAKAMSGILPSLLSGMADKASTTDGAAMIAKLAGEANSAGVLNNLSGFFGTGNNDMMSKGSDMLGSLFGDNKTSLLTSAISRFAGVKSSTSSSLMSMAAPLILGLLGKQMSLSNLLSSGLSSFFGSQKSNITKAMPSGLDLSSIFNMSSADASHRPAAHHHTPVEEKSSGGMGKLLPILLLALATAAAWYFFKDGCNKKVEDSAAVVTDTIATDVKEAVVDMKNAVTGKLDTVTNEFIYDLGETITFDLPNGLGKLELGKNSTEYRLFSFLNDKNQLLDTVKGNWFEFTNVRFKTNSSEINDISDVQLKNLVAISKAFPNAKFKIGGYTDNIGDAAANVALSQKRAESVTARLNKLGIGTGVMDDPKGYGQEWPIADNATAEGRAQNRRVAINVKSK